MPPTATPTLIPLDAPGNVRTTEYQRVAWDAVTGATKYRVEWSPAIGVKTSAEVTETNYFLGNMVYDRKYTVRVRALTTKANYESEM